MDLIRNDIIIDKMAVDSVGTSYVITLFADFTTCNYWIIKVRGYVDSMIWQCEIVPQT